MALNTAIIIQARIGSTRLPGKVVLPFWNKKSILDIIIEKSISAKVGRVILSTTNNDQDKILCEIAKKHRIDFFEGSEFNVLKRFIDTAKHFLVDNIIRICADNPFITIHSIIELCNFISLFPEKDYISYCDSKGKPTIKTHLGFYPEMVKLDSLMKVCKLTNNRIYKEHVTNYLYENKDIFDCYFLPVHGLLSNQEYIRLTIDDEQDFKIGSQIYEALFPEIEIDNVVDYLKKHEEIQDLMIKQIAKNKK